MGVTTHEGLMDGTGMRVGIVCGRFNDLITTRLLDGAVDTLRRHGVQKSDITVAWVPGAFEIPLVVKTMAASGRHDAILALGAVIRGSTDHYDHVAGQCAAGIQRAQLDTGVPCVFEVLTTHTIEQAIERAGTKVGNKGVDAAQAAVEMVDLLRKLA